MKEIVKNRLFALLPTEENLKLLAEYPHSFSNQDHILIICGEDVPGALEITSELIRFLQDADREWLMLESRKILEEQKEQYAEQVLIAQKEFFRRFKELLEKEKEAVNSGEQ